MPLLRNFLFVPPPAPPPPGGYQGLINAVPGATFFLGLRAATAALIGTNALRVRRTSDDAESDIVTVSGGGLDVATLNTFSSNFTIPLTVRTWYDQLTGAWTFDQTTNGDQPAFYLDYNGLGWGPSIEFGGGKHLNLASMPATIAHPITIVSVAKHFEAQNVLGSMFQCTAVPEGGVTVGHTENADEVFSYSSGGLLAAPATGDVWHSLINIFNGAVNSGISVDGGSIVTGNAGSGSGTDSGSNARIGASSFAGQEWSGLVSEIAFYQSAFLSEVPTVYSNHTAYYTGL